MKIAIVQPSPVPFTIGGVENLGWGLQHHINQNTPHQAELIKLPTREGNFWNLVQSYHRFSELNVSHFDMVISSKYPAWMVQHPNHVCYMQHRLRGLYDTYHLTGLPIKYTSCHTIINQLQEFMRRHSGVREALLEFFDRVDQLRTEPNLPIDVFQFPGPLAREVIHFLDGIGLGPDSVRKFSAISNTVAKRKDYFPGDSAVEVIYHPSNLQSFRCDDSSYFFTVSRLDGAKRIGLLIEAMQYVKANIELRIAGSGPAVEHLRQLAGDDNRIVFLGFVNDEELIELYANAIAIPYVPYEEDYGLITIEAMMSGKPVLTASDSGGPNELVKDGHNGYIVDPSPRAIGKKLDFLYHHKDLARCMGLAAAETVKCITWQSVVVRLLDDPPISVPKVKRRKITVATTFPVYPPRGGGQCRVFHLYRHTARDFDVDLVTFTGAGEKPLNAEIAPNLREIRIPKSLEHEQAEAEITAKVNWTPVTDVAMPELFTLSPDYLSALRESALSADIVVASHPYLLPAIRQVTAKPIWYEAQDVEIELKREILPDTATGRRLLNLTEQVERECCEVSEKILVCCTEDGEKLIDLYQLPNQGVIVVPNGFDPSTIDYSSLEDRLALKQRLSLEATFTALFMGSWHGPNISAVKRILKMAEELPHIHFLIMGNVCSAFNESSTPSNVGYMGVVDDQTKGVILNLVDLALNPMEAGSGTNLKMLDYCAAGVPVITTMQGARGLRLKHDEHIILSDIDRFSEAIVAASREDRQVSEARSFAAWDLVRREYAWDIIAENLIRKLEA